jgi:hypothetical protein
MIYLFSALPADHFSGHCCQPPATAPSGGGAGGGSLFGDGSFDGGDRWGVEHPVPCECPFCGARSLAPFPELSEEQFQLWDSLDCSDGLCPVCDAGEVARIAFERGLIGRRSLL